MLPSAVAKSAASLGSHPCGAQLLVTGVGIDDEEVAAPLPSPTPAVVEVAAGDAVSDAVALPCRPSSTPVVEDDAVPPVHGPLAHGFPKTPPSSPSTGARRRLVALGLPLPSPSSGGRRRRAAGTWSPAALRLANGDAPGTRFPGDYSDEDAYGGSSSVCR